jgi:nucleoside-diphosphate-sugar epimerase
MRRILITGGSGFIGTNLVEFYRQAESTQVLNYDVLKPRFDAHVDLWVQGDLLDSQKLLSTMGDFQPTHLVHLAARTDLRGKSIHEYQSNTDGVRAVLDCATAFGSLKRAVFASSRLVCNIAEAPSNEYDYYPPNYYGRSKVIGEQLVRAHRHPGEWLIVRPTSIWGPWFGSPYRDLFLSLARGTYIHPGHERIQKHFGYVGNTIFQLDRMLTAPSEQVHGKTFYLADYEPIEVGRFAELIRRSIGLSRSRSAPVSLLRLLARAGDAMKTAGLLEPPLTSFRLKNLRTTMLFKLDEVNAIVGKLPFTVQEGIDITITYLRDEGDLRRLVRRSV